MNKIIDELLSLKDEYYAMSEVIDLKGPDAQEINFNALNYPDLLRIRKDMSCLSVDLGKVVGENKKYYEKAEGQRKLEYYNKKRYYMETMEYNASKSTGFAESDVVDFMTNSATLNGLYFAGKFVLDQINEVLKSLNQDISIIKKEYESLNNIS